MEAKKNRSASPLSLFLSHYIVIVIVTKILHCSAAIGSVIARFRQSIQCSPLLFVFVYKRIIWRGRELIPSTCTCPLCEI